MSPFKILYPFLLAALLFPTVRVKGQINLTDSLALVDLYNSTNGNGWTNKTNWLTTQPVTSWYGITVNTNRVSQIILNTNNLTGTLPSTIGNLSALQMLQLDANAIGGTIPTSMGNLLSLQFFSIVINQLTGTIPPSLGNLTNLGWLRIADNQLSGSLPTSLGNLSSLGYMDFGHNQFSGTIPPSLGNLSNLIELILTMNQLTGTIPASLGNLTNLEYLELDLNQLTGSIPPSIGNLQHLWDLTLDFNHLSGTVPVIIGNPSFFDLALQFNDFTFAGMESLTQTEATYITYAPQGIIPVHVSCGKLWVSVGGTPSNNTYRWFDSGGNLKATIVSDSTFTPAIPGNYYVEVTNYIATQLTLHSDTTTSKSGAEGLFVPNAFTPNGDGHNDLLRPINLNNEPVSQFRFAIFNRWGQRIFESRDPSSGWDGRMLGTEQPTGVYVWQLEYQFPQAPLVNHSGTVVLIR